MVVLLVCGCSDTEDGTGSETGSGSMSMSGSESSSESTEGTSASSTGSSGDTSSSSGSGPEDSGTTGTPTTCDEATDITTCMAAGHASQTCIWLVGRTVVADGDALCQTIDVGPTGVCAIDEQDDGCGTPEATCPDDLTAVWYREVGLEVGAIEVVAFGASDVCEGPGGGFQPCTYDAQAGTFLPPECGCGCPMGR